MIRFLRKALVVGLLLSAPAAQAADRIPAGGAPIDMKDVVVKLTLITQQNAAKLGIKTGKATCPGSVIAKPNKVTKFQCTVPYESEIAPYIVTFDLTNNSFDISPDRAILSTKLLGDFAVSQLTRPDPTAKADCGKGKVLIRPVGAIVTCSVKGTSGSGAIAIKVTSVNGNVTIVA